MKKNGFKRILAGALAFAMVFTNLTLPEVHAEETVKTETEVHSITAAKLNAVEDIDASYFNLSGDFTLENKISTDEGDVAKNSLHFKSDKLAAITFSTKGISAITVDAGCIDESGEGEFTLMDAEGNAVVASHTSASGGLESRTLIGEDGQMAYNLSGNDSNVFTFENVPEGTYTLTSLGMEYRRDVLLFDLSVSSVYEVAPEKAPEEQTPEETPKVEAPVVTVTTTDKIDAFDFGGQALDESIYNNILTEDVINSWYPGVDGGTKGKNLASFEVKNAEGKTVLAFNDGGFTTTHRLRSTNTNITRYDDKSLKSADGLTIYTGYVYSNKSGTNAVYLSLACEAGDIVKVYAACNSGNSEIVFDSENGDKQSSVHTLGSSVAGEYTFYAKEAGTYKIYSANEKLVVARILVEHCPEVTVSGEVTAPQELTDYSLVFTNKATGAATSASVVNGKYTANLNSKYSYAVSLENANGYVVVEGDELSLAKAPATHNVKVLSVSLVTVTGELKGDMTDEALAKAAFVIKAQDADKIYVPSIVWSGRNFTASLEKGVKYDLILEGVDDYEVKTPEISADNDENIDIIVTLKPVYEVTINPEGAALSDLSDAEFTFIRHSDSDVTKEEDYSYTFTGTEGIALRSGVYTVKVKATDYKQKLTSNLVVNDSQVTKKIGFAFAGDSSTSVSWKFTGDDYTGQPSYEGLVITGGQKHSSNYGMMIKNGTIEIPVKGNSRIDVSIGYTWDISLNGGEAVTQTSDGGMQKVSFDYTGAAGTVTLSAGTNATSYISGITVTPVSGASYPETSTGDIKLTVGAAGCNYTTINDALNAVRSMNRADGQRVIIEIQPGNYEEMLVIDVPNVSLVNANSNPSIKPVNKGVDIEASSVRVTSYYGHGYTYYSMNNNCKYDEELLAVNKENGYPSFENPGSGTTNGSYWNATVTVSAEGFVAEGIIFENSFNQYVSEKAANDIIVKQSSAKEGSVPRASMEAGDTTVQNKKYVERAAALAITDNVAKVSFDNCAFIGRQDTLYGGKGSTVAFYACDIYGGTDYIFGGMTAVFAKCNLVANTMEDSNDTFYITAAQQKSGRGYLMYNCNIISTEPGVNTASETVSKAGALGRPWEGKTSEVVFYATNIGESSEAGISLIVPDGWNSTLGGTSDNVYEFGSNEMSGADNAAKRVAWAHTSDSIEGAKLADGTEVSVEAFLGNWNPFDGKDMTIVVADKIEHEEPETPADGEKVEITTYVLNAADHAAVAQGAKADGEEEKLGTNNFFTVIYSSKSKVDSSSKSFEDGFASSMRFNLGGVASVDKNSVKFTTTHKNAVVKVWWVEGGDDKRQMAILDKDGKEVARTDATLAKNDTCVSTFTLNEAGTYYLGSVIGNNYIFKVEVTETVSYVYVDHKYVLDSATDLTAFAAGAKADGDEEKLGTNKYFTAVYSTKSKVDESSKTFEDGYASGLRINLGGAASTSKNAVKFTTTSDNASVKIWWVEGGDDNRQMAILDKDGNIVAKTDITIAKNATAISTLTVPKAGTYYLGGATNNNYIFKIEVTEKILEPVDGVVEAPERKAWNEVSNPVIASAVQDGNTVKVTVNTVIGSNGADYIEVICNDANGNEVQTKKSSKEGESVEVTLELSASGTYSFAVNAVREDEEAVHTSETVSVNYVLPLSVPSFKTAANAGSGLVNVSWDSVDEATGYVLYADGKEVLATDKLSGQIDLSALIGTTVKLTVKAVRGEDASALSEALSISVKGISEREWGFSAYGSSVSASKNGYTGSVNDGSVTIYSTGNGGKIVPNSSDGLAFYYTVIDPDTENFTLEADITVDTWTFSNAQEGFGIMAADTIGKNYDGNTYWNNSIQNIVSKVEYDSEIDPSAKITMKLGVGALVRLGVTADDFATFKATGGFANGTLPAGFTTETTTLERSGEAFGVGTYNIVGNCTNTPDGTYKELTTFHMSLQRNNTGYILKYYDEDGNVVGEKLVYDIDRTELTRIDKDHIYLGFFAARNAKITVNNVKLTTIDPADDAPAEEREIEYVDVVCNVESATTANTEDYELVVYTNADGRLTVKTNDGKTVAENHEVKAMTKAHFGVKLENENTTFNVEFTPDSDYMPGEYKKLSSYDTVSFAHSVYAPKQYFGTDFIYVAPWGNGNGTYSSPASIYDAVKYAKPGQIILLAGGTYKLRSTVKIERGHNGTANEPIVMMTNPNDDSRAVLDFQGICAGTVFAGDYWKFVGFDVTNSANGQKGIQVSGSHNVLDDIHTYKNGNTGIQISRYLGTDKKDQWPSDNLILNCTSYLNADAGYEDADGFAAKLTIGEGNVFDGCISAFNADDGWDLFAKAETGPIGKVVIKNSVAFMNGYVLDSEGKLINAGNGNGFKMGGESLSGYHTLINSVAFANKAKGIDSNSCPDIQVYNSVSFDNGSYNVAFYTNNAVNTDFYAENVISFNVANKVAEQLKLKGTQKNDKVNNASNFFVGSDNVSVNSEGTKVSSEWFESIDKDAVVAEAVKEILAGTFGCEEASDSIGIERNDDGTIAMNGFLVVTDKAPEQAGAKLSGNGTASLVINTKGSEATVDEPAPAPAPVTPPSSPSDDDNGQTEESGNTVVVSPGTGERPTEPSRPASQRGQEGNTQEETVENVTEQTVTEAVVPENQVTVETTENVQETVTEPEVTPAPEVAEIEEPETPLAAPSESGLGGGLIAALVAAAFVLTAGCAFFLRKFIIKK